MKDKYISWNDAPVKVATKNEPINLLSLMAMKKHHDQVHYLYFMLSENDFYRKICDGLYREQLIQQSISLAMESWCEIFGEETFDDVSIPEIKTILRSYHEIMINYFTSDI
ncbi:hypothetical protein [Citrobacter koseri]|uniref:hypothetical protein n=1 Tax=Citrobacter koseri TaxID=545 RepID=UPI0038922FD0